MYLPRTNSTSWTCTSLHATPGAGTWSSWRHSQLWTTRRSWPPSHPSSGSRERWQYILFFILDMTLQIFKTTMPFSFISLRFLNKGVSMMLQVTLTPSYNSKFYSSLMFIPPWIFRPFKVADFKNIFPIASKPINIRLIRTGFQPYWKIKSNAVLCLVFYEYKIF